MQWIDRGVLTLNGKEYGYGDELPKLDPELKKDLLSRGVVGDVPKAYNPQDIINDTIRGLQEKLGTVSKEKEDLLKKVADLEKKLSAAEKKGEKK